MRILTATICILALAGCTRPSSSLSLADLTRAASAGLNEYFEWVEKDESKFPNALCLAGVLFEVKLSDTRSSSAGVSVPLAAPSAGLTSLFGYSLSVTEENVGVITFPMHAVYQGEEEPKGAKERKEKEAQYKEALTKFIDDITDLQKSRDAQPRGAGDIRLPKGVDAATFADGSDLALELWTIREAIHDMVLNSPNGIIFVPGEVPVVQEYRLTKETKATAKLSLASKGAADFSAGNKATDYNRMAIFFTRNEAINKMECSRGSVSEETLKNLKMPK